MSWERTKATTKELPEAPSLVGWLAGGILAIIVCVLLFILHAFGTLKVLSGLNIWWFSLAPFICWFCLFCLRGWLWGKEVDEYQFLQKEAEYAQKQWEEWAERHLAVIGSCVCLPDEMSAASISGDVVQQYGLTRAINSLPEEHSAVESAIRVLIKAIEKSISLLPKDLPLRVKLVTDEQTQTAERAFTSAWKDILTGRPAPVTIECRGLFSPAWVEERLKQPILDIALVFVVQLNGGEAYSDGLAALLLTSDDVAQKYQLPHSTRILRPMPLDMAHFKTDMELFLETQTVACRSSRIFCDSKIWHDQFADLMTTGTACKAPWKPEDIGVLEKWSGIPGPASAWLLTALAADVAAISKAPVLGLFTSGTDHFVSTITPGSEQ
ncbi:type VI secretion protein [Cronobacter turicensis]